jgi:hypothetical protein
MKIVCDPDLEKKAGKKLVGLKASEICAHYRHEGMPAHRWTELLGDPYFVWYLPNRNTIYIVKGQAATRLSNIVARLKSCRRGRHVRN